jgi:hypothetical protein
VCIFYRGNVSTEPLSSNDKEIFTEPLPSSDKGIVTEPLPSNDKGIFNEPLPSNGKGLLPSRCLATIRGIHRHRQQRDHISLPYYYFFQNKESRLKTGLKEMWFEGVNWIHLETGMVQRRPVANVIRNLERRGKF